MNIPSAKPGITNPLDINTELAVTRTRLAADRTLLSWIRTAIAMITFGFGIIKFFEFFKALPNTYSHPHLEHISSLGSFLILMGILILIPGYVEQRKALKMLNRLDGLHPWSYASIVAILVALIGLYALYNVTM
ncbi:MAG: DUF202 domain-containing protein [Parachlamydiales bacterium]|jgi:putative membrane protein